MGVVAGLYMCDVVKKFTFAISSPDEFLYFYWKHFFDFHQWTFLKLPQDVDWVQQESATSPTLKLYRGSINEKRVMHPDDAHSSFLGLVPAIVNLCAPHYSTIFTRAKTWLTAAPLSSAAKLPLSVWVSKVRYCKLHLTHNKDRKKSQNLQKNVVRGSFKVTENGTIGYKVK